MVGSDRANQEFSTSTHSVLSFNHLIYYTFHKCLVLKITPSKNTELKAMVEIQINDLMDFICFYLTKRNFHEIECYTSDTCIVKINILVDSISSVFMLNCQNTNYHCSHCNILRCLYILTLSPKVKWKEIYLQSYLQCLFYNFNSCYLCRGNKVNIHKTHLIN